MEDQGEHEHGLDQNLRHPWRLAPTGPGCHYGFTQETVVPDEVDRPLTDA